MKRALLTIQVIVTVGLLAAIFARVDWRALADVMGRVTPAFYVATLLISAAAHVAYAFRWHRVLAGLKVTVPFSVVARQHFIALFISNLLPTAVAGDAAKVYYLGRTAGYVDVGASVFVDRFIGLYWLTLFGAMFAVANETSTPVLRVTRDLLIAVAAAMTTLIAISLASPRQSPQPATASWKSRVLRLLHRVRDAIRDVPALSYAAGITIVFQLVMAVVYVEFFRLNGAGAPPLLALLTALCGMSVAINVPISVNGVGLREQLHIVLFTTMGLGREEAVAISLLLFSQLLLLSLVGGVAWLNLRRRTR